MRSHPSSKYKTIHVFSHQQSSYRNIREVTVNTTKLIATPVTGLCRPLPSALTTNAPTPSVPTETASISSAIIGTKSIKEEEWIAHSQQLLQRIFVSHDDALSWAASCASNQPSLTRPPCIWSMLHIFRQKSSSPNMIYHAMSLIKAATSYLNSWQSPAITLDQPLYAICKAIQWDQATEFNENNYCVFLGTLHSEMLMEKLLRMATKQWMYPNAY